MTRPVKVVLRRDGRGIPRDVLIPIRPHRKVSRNGASTSYELTFPKSILRAAELDRNEMLYLRIKVKPGYRDLEATILSLEEARELAEEELGYSPIVGGDDDGS